MPITISEVEKIARLAKLQLSAEEKEKFSRQLGLILEYMEKLNEVDTSGIEPLSHPLDLKNVYREDRVRPSLPVDEALGNAPQRKGDYFKVPRVINK